MSRCIAVAILLVVTGCNDHGSPRDIDSRTSAAHDSSIDPKTEHRAVVTLTPAAVEKLRESQQPDKPFLRVAVVTAGTTGFMYDMKFDDHVSPENDYVNDTYGVTTVVDKRSSLFLDGATIDWQTDSDGKQGFKFDNPNALK